MQKWKKQLMACLSWKEQVKDLMSPHMVNLRIRINGEWKEYDADWIADLVREEFPEFSPFKGFKER